MAFQQTASFADELIAFRRELHSYPELSLQEQETAERIAAQLDKLNVPYKRNIGGHGIVAELKGVQAGPTIALRADMDALPIEEETGLPYVSKNKGNMHACGHDAHTAMLLGAVKLLQQQRLAGSVRFIFQAAEEINAGAKAMVAEGVLDGVDEIYGLHNLPTLETGKLATCAGAMMGSVDRIDIFIQGKGAHGAIPNEGIDPIVCGSAIIIGLQTIISRELSPFDPTVITIGSIKAGEANNVIPHTATMTGTVRTFNSELQATMKQRIERIVQSIAASYRCQAVLQYTEQVPVLVNSSEQLQVVNDVIDRYVGKECRVEAAPTLAGEDFSVYLKQMPGCFFWLGSGPEHNAHEAYGLHHPKYTLNERCLEIGATLLAAIAKERLDELARRGVER